MHKERIAVSRTVTNGLAELEQLLDAAAVKLAELQIAAITGRRSAHLPLDAGQIGLDRLAEAGATIGGARKTVHEAHYAFRATREQLRLPVTSYGDTGDTPTFAPMADAQAAPVLALVEIAA